MGWYETADCPFCKSRPSWHRHPGGIYAVHCTNANCQGYDDPVTERTLDDAVEAWNRWAALNDAAS